MTITDTTPNFGFDDDVTVSLGFDESFTEVITGSETHMGTRSYQQDAFFVTETVAADPGTPIKSYAVLCDGMGGLEDGEKVSNFVVGHLATALYGLEDDEGADLFFVNEIHRVDKAVCAAFGGEGGAPSKSGTTLTAALIFGGSLHWASVGDSRIYIIRGGDMVQVSRDHNYSLLLAEQVKQGLISAEQAEGDPRRGALISFIGSGRVSHIDTNSSPFALANGDIVLLCSDGLNKSLADMEILNIVRDHYGDMAAAAKDLTLQAFDNGDGAKDNTSVILMQYFI